MKVSLGSQITRKITIPVISEEKSVSGIVVNITLPSGWMAVDSITSLGAFNGSSWVIPQVLPGVSPVLELTLEAIENCPTGTRIQAEISSSTAICDNNPNNNLSYYDLLYVTCCDIESCMVDIDGGELQGIACYTDGTKNFNVFTTLKADGTTVIYATQVDNISNKIDLPLGIPSGWVVCEDNDTHTPSSVALENGVYIHNDGQDTLSQIGYSLDVGSGGNLFLLDHEGNLVSSVDMCCESDIVLESVDGSGIGIVRNVDEGGTITYTFDLDPCSALDQAEDNGRQVEDTDRLLVKQVDGTCEIKSINTNRSVIAYRYCSEDGPLIGSFVQTPQTSGTLSNTTWMADPANQIPTAPHTVETLPGGSVDTIKLSHNENPSPSILSYEATNPTQITNFEVDLYDIDRHPNTPVLWQDRITVNTFDENGNILNNGVSLSVISGNSGLTVSGNSVTNTLQANDPASDNHVRVNINSPFSRVEIAYDNADQASYDANPVTGVFGHVIWVGMASWDEIDFSQCPMVVDVDESGSPVGEAIPIDINAFDLEGLVIPLPGSISCNTSYQTPFSSLDWTTTSGESTLIIPQSTHEICSGLKHTTVFDIEGNEVVTGVQNMSSGDISLTITTPPFDGYVYLSK